MEFSQSLSGCLSRSNRALSECKNVMKLESSRAWRRDAVSCDIATSFKDWLTIRYQTTPASCMQGFKVPATWRKGASKRAN